MLPQDWLPDDSILEGMRALGAPPEVIARVSDGIEARRAKLEAIYGNGDCEIWPENLLAFQAFIALQHQWNYVAMDGIRVGLRFESIRAWLEINITGRQQNTRRRELFADLLVMERAVINADRELAAQTRKE